jgi:thiol-disulfide isomerase/thioredoxin
MKKTILTFFVVVLTSACSNSQKTAFSIAALSEKVTAFDGKEVALQEILNKHKGKGIVIEFWASWCGDCVKAMPKMQALQSENPTVDYVFISLDKNVEKWKLGIEKHELKGDHYWISDSDGMKGTFGKEVDLDWIPRYMVVDKTGKIALYRAIETDFDKINSTLKTL